MCGWMDGWMFVIVERELRLGGLGLPFARGARWCLERVGPEAVWLEVRLRAERSGLGAAVRGGLRVCKDQASKGIWWMPWHREAKKDVARCDKLRGGASAR
jgi:hypothetical protein